MHNYILLDRSGSMISRWEETIAALNAYVTELGKDESTQKGKISVYAFDTAPLGGLSFQPVREKVKVSDWTNIETNEIGPRGMTPLYDAIAKLCNVIGEKSPKKATVVIMTDGEENGSREISNDSAKKMLDALREDKGYDVVFIGADFDAFGSAQLLGNSSHHTLNMTQDNYAGAMASLASKSADYSKTGMTRAFTDEERAKATGK